MRPTSGARILVFGALLACGRAAALPPAEARLEAVRGKVLVYAKDAARGYPARAGQSLRAGERLTTGPRSSAELRLGGGGFLYLGADSDLLLKGVRQTGGAFDLSVGTLLVKTPSPNPSGDGCRVRTPTATAAGCGAEFGVVVSPYDRGLTHIAVFDEGAVEVRGLSGHARTLQAGHETSVLDGGGPRPFSAVRKLAPQHRLMRWMRKRVQGAATVRLAPSVRRPTGR